MTEFGIPLPPDDLVMVWDKDADPWMREQDGRGHPGGMWAEARTGINPSKFKWAELISRFGPLTDFEPRCEATAYFGDFEQVEQKFRCLLAPNHSGHHKLPENCWSTP